MRNAGGPAGGSPWSVVVATLLALALLPAAARAPGTAGAGRASVTLRVPQDFPGVQQAVDASRPGDLLLVAPGVYPGDVRVREGRSRITIRGTDRGGVVFDGGHERRYAFEVEADGVTLENMTARNFAGNAFYWENVDGYAGRYLTAHNVGEYGLYAVGSRDGVLEHSHASGAGRAAYYIGECFPCDTVLTGLTARYSELGYSGTNAGGNLVIKDSLWELNGSGILLSTYDEEKLPPQRSATVTGNTVRGNGTVPTPSAGPLGGYVGVGIGIAGGMDNVVEGNSVSDNAGYGIAVFAAGRTGGGAWPPAGNVVRRNAVGGSGRADLAIGEGSGEGNCFDANAAVLTLPGGIEGSFPCAGEPPRALGDAAVAKELTMTLAESSRRRGERPSYRSMPVPGPQPNMPPPAPPRSRERWPEGLAWPAAVLAVAAAALVSALAIRRRGS